MQFRKISENKYIGEHGFTAVRSSNNLFCICKDGQVAEWGTGFTTIAAAEEFLNKHNYLKASNTFLPFDEEEIQFIIEMYGNKLLKKGYNGPGWDLWSIDDDYSIAGDNKQGQNVIDIFKDGNLLKEFDSESGLFEQLDKIACSDNIFASIGFVSLQHSDIFAAKRNKKTARQITDDLVRVRSSNVWSYGIDVDNSDPEVGDVYVQFKGEHGGPGDIYRYYSVPLRIWRRIISYPSKGAAVWKFLRNNFPYSKLTGDRRGVLPNAINN